MPSTYKGLTVPDYSDAPDGPADFRAFGDSLSAATVLGSTGMANVTKTVTGIAGTVRTNTAYATFPAADLPPPTTIVVTSLLMLRVIVDVTPKPGSVFFLARLVGIEASVASVFESAGRGWAVVTALLSKPAGPLLFSIETMSSAAAGATINSVEWNLFSTGGVS